MLLLLLVQCGTTDISKSYSPEQANRLLTGDTAKTWALVSRFVDDEDGFGPCLENNTLTFVKAAAGDSLYQLGRVITCGSISVVDTLYKAKYTLASGTDDIFQNSIALTEEEILTVGTFQVEELTSIDLTLRYSADGTTIVERYSY